MSNIKILIIGFGSIGQRHYNNLKILGYKNIFIHDNDSRRIKGSKVKVLDKVNVKSLTDFNVVFVCTPDEYHIKYSLLAAKAGCDIFIEKPLSNSLRHVSELQKLCRKNKLITLIGCNMRFHPCLQYIKKYIDQGKLGTIYSRRFEFGHYLPYWRPGENYQKIYKSGIILNDIHEFDLLFWSNDFVKIKKSSFLFGTVSKLKGVGEDQCIASFYFNNNTFGLVQCDYLQQSYRRNCKIVGAKGSLYWDFKENVIWLEARNSKKNIFSVKNFDFNKSYLDQTKYFFRLVKNRQQTFNNVNRAAETLSHLL